MVRVRAEFLYFGISPPITFFFFDPPLFSACVPSVLLGTLLFFTQFDFPPTPSLLKQ